MSNPKDQMLQLVADAFGLPGPKAKEEGKCPLCGNNVGAFKDALSEKEFGISGMCQKCQDEMFD